MTRNTKKNHLIATNLYNYRTNNVNYPIQNWYNIVEGFSTHFVEQKLAMYDIKHGDKVVDPFCGGGTTPLVCKYKNIDSVGIDANPWTWLVATCKTNWSVDIESLKSLHIKIAKKIPRQFLDYENSTGFIFRDNKQQKLFGQEIPRLKIEYQEELTLPRIDEKISPIILDKIVYLKKLITRTLETFGTVDESISRLIWFTFGSRLMEVSNMTWFGPKVTWRNASYYDAPFFTLFLEMLARIEKDLNAAKNLKNKTNTKIILGDSRHVDDYIDKDKFDLALTSPPYMNEACYCDQSQFQLFLLDLVSDLQDLRKVKKRMITCNTKYIFSDSNDSKHVKDFNHIMEIYDKMKLEERRDEKKWGWDRPKMLIEYFGGMKMHLESMYKILKDDSKYAIIIGDSAIAGVHIPTDKLFIELSKEIGFSDASLEVFRHRQSSRHKIALRESIVTLTK